MEDVRVIQVGWRVRMYRSGRSVEGQEVQVRDKDARGQEGIMTEEKWQVESGQEVFVKG